MILEWLDGRRREWESTYKLFKKEGDESAGYFYGGMLSAVEEFVNFVNQGGER